MATPQKKKKVEALTDRLKKSKAVYLTDYQGLTHQELQDLRSKVKQADADYSIVKNTLFKIALNNSNFKGLALENIANTGPTAVLFTYADPIKPLQTFAATAKERIKAALAFGEYLTGNALQRLVDLEPEETIRAKLVTQLASPLNNLAHALNWNMQRLTLTFNEIKHVKGGE